MNKTIEPPKRYGRRNLGPRPQEYEIRDINGSYRFLDQCLEVFSHIRAECVDSMKSNPRIRGVPSKTSGETWGRRLGEQLYPDFPLKTIAVSAGRSAVRLIANDLESDEVRYIVLTMGVSHGFNQPMYLDGFGKLVADRPIRFIRRCQQLWLFNKEGDTWYVRC